MQDNSSSQNRHSWPNDIFGNSGFYIHGFVYSGLKLSCLPYSADLFWWFLLWQPPKWEVWNKHSWAEGSKALNFQNPEYPKKEKESPQPWISATGSWWSIIFQFNISGKFSQNLWPIQISVWFHHFNYKSKLEMSVTFSFVVLWSIMLKFVLAALLSNPVVKKLKQNTIGDNLLHVCTV